jgi:aryl-alcohol dehydrogenase-like predicted oxidoreductase
METRELGQSGLEVTVVGLGCWVMGGWMWGGAEDDRSVASIRRAVELGVNFVDTAPIYGHGHSEELVGKALEGLRDDVVLATKCGLVWPPREGRHHFVGPDGIPVYHNLAPASIMAECEDSLRRLRTDVIDVYQCHWPDPGTPLDDTMAALLKLREQGKVRAVGVSNFSVGQMQQCLEHGRIESDQPQYNLLDRSVEEAILPFCREHDLGVIAYSPLGRGILTGKVTMDREFEQDDHRANLPWYQPKNRRRVLDFLDKVRPVAEGHGVTLAQLAANWVICQEGVTTAICGARRPEQVEENVKAGAFRLSDEELAEIDRLRDELGSPE